MDRRDKWAALVAAVLMATVVGIVAYNAGVSQGLAINVPAAAAGGVPGPYYYGCHRPWGFWGFPRLLLIVFAFLAFRLLFWGRFHRRGLADLTGPWKRSARRACFGPLLTAATSTGAQPAQRSVAIVLRSSAS